MAADAITRVGQWLRSTVPGDLARAVGDPAAAVRTDDVAAVLDALAAAQRESDALRAERDEAREAAEIERVNAATVLTADGMARTVCGEERAAALDALAAQTARADRAERLLGDVYALATGDVDGVPSDPVLAMNRSIGAIAKLHHRANDLTEQRDAAVAQRKALAGAVRAAVEHERAVTQRERDEIGARWFGDLADVPVVAVARATLDALLDGAAPVVGVRALAAKVRDVLAREDAWRDGIGAYLPGEDVTAYVARRDAERTQANEAREKLDALVNNVLLTAVPRE